MSSESSGLRTVLEAVLDEPLVEPRPVEDVARRGRRIVARHRRRRAVARFAVLVLLTTFGLRTVLLDAADDRVRVTDGPKPPAETTTTVAPSPIPFHDTAAPGTPSVGAPAPSPQSPAAVRTPAAAAGEPSRCDAITGSTVRVGVPLEGVYAVRAAADRANRAGGVCGRPIDVVLGGDAPLTVEPYALSPAEVARITAEHAYAELGARTFAVVHERAYASAASALAEYLPSRPGAALRVSQVVEGAHLSHAITGVSQACGSGCDAVLLAMRPTTITAWLEAGGPTARRETAALPVAMDPKWPFDCARDAGDRCREVAVWLPYRLPGASFDHPDLRQYEWDARSVGRHPQDAEFLSWYVGLRLLVASLQQAPFESTLLGPPHSARKYRMEMDDGRFVGWRDVSENWRSDPR